MSKDEIVLQLTLKLLENFEYNFQDFGGQSVTEHGENVAKNAAIIFNTLQKELKTDVETDLEV